MKSSPRYWLHALPLAYALTLSFLVAVFAPLVFLTLWMGVYPPSFTDFFRPSVDALVSHHQAALAGQHRLAESLRQGAAEFAR